MKKYLLIALFSFPTWANELVIGVETGNNNPGFGDGRNALYLNDSGQPDISLLAGEDQTNGVFKTESQFSYKICTSDCQISAAAGYVHSITCATPAGAAVAAGAITLRNAATETTPIVATIGIPNSAFTPFTLVLDVVLSATGMYLGYDGTVGAVSCTVSYR